MQNLKCVAVGDGAVGKTCLLISYTEDKFPYDYIPTVFDNYSKNVVVDGQKINLGLWDTAGQEDFDRFRPIAYKDTDVFMICGSVISPDSFKNADQKWFKEIHEHAPEVRCVLVGTKIDLRKDDEVLKSLQASGAEPVSKERGKGVAKTHGAEYVECSALTQQGLPEVFDTVIRQALQGPKPLKEESKCCTIL